MNRSLRILVVDDDFPVLMAVGAILSKRGHKVAKATTARQALEILKKVGIDFIISDIAMPDMNGIEFIKNIRRRDRTTPILMLSALNEQRTVQNAAASGANGYLVKPFDSMSLVKKVETIAQRAQESA